ncbi:MAG: MATE family efflux transporter [Christensenellales bacterium]
MEQTIKSGQNKMGVMPIGKLLFSMALPIAISMLVQACYNVIDSIFVAKLGEDALTAVSLAFPVQNVIVAIAVGTGVGVNSLLSKSLGQRNFARANKVASNAIILAIINTAVVALIGGLFARKYYEIQTDIESIITMGTEYTFIVCVISVGVFFQVTFERLLQATGKTLLSMAMQLVGAVVNIVLDPIFIFGYLGAPAMGVKGAAVATVIGQLLSMLTGLLLNVFFNKEIKITFKDMLPDKKLLARIYKVAIPSMLMASITSVTVFGFNQILLAFNTETSLIGNTATSFLGIYFKLQSFVFMPVFGINNAMIPIIAYNFGARQKSRIWQTVKISVVAAVSIMLVGFLILQCFPQAMLRLFEASDDMMSIGTVGLRALSVSFLIAGFNIVMSGLFQAVGNALYSLVMSLSRQIIIALPVAWLLSKTGKINAIWWSLTIAEALTLFFSLFFLKRTNRRISEEIAADNTKNIQDNTDIVDEKEIKVSDGLSDLSSDNQPGSETNSTDNLI